MQMMYETIHDALVEVGLEGVFSPQDYLNFFCLGNREAMGPHDNVGDKSPGSVNTPQVGLYRSNFCSSCVNLLFLLLYYRDLLVRADGS